MDGVELAKVGAKIAELGVKLNELREKRDGLNEKIGELEKELNPLVVRHSQLIAEIVGKPTPSPVVSQTGGAGVPPVGSPASSAVKARVFQFLKRSHDSVSAREVSEALSLPPNLVREVMREMMRPRTPGPEPEPEPETDGN